MKMLEPGRKRQKPDNNAALKKERDIDTLARTIWGEARGEGNAGMQAVANVVMNRVRHGGWWGNDIEAVCRKPFQFSCWNKDDPNCALLPSIDEKDIHFATALRIARRAACGVLADITDGADHYHAAGIYPLWSRGEKPVAVIGRHIFYRLTKG